jgi:hypothetical protein
MENVLVAQSWQSKQSVKGWGASLVFHACLALVAFGLMPKMATIVEKEPFKWDVALVEPPREVVRQEEPAPAPQVQRAGPLSKRISEQGPQGPVGPMFQKLVSAPMRTMRLSG